MPESDQTGGQAAAKQAFLLRIAPSGIDRVRDALEADKLIIGWAATPGLLQERDWHKFRKAIHNDHYRNENSYRKAGSATGNMWRFIHEMKVEDLIVVPHHGSFYLAEIIGPAEYHEDLVDDDTAYRRPVKWLNDKKPIPRSKARAALMSRMKAQGTCYDITDIIQDVEAVLAAVDAGEDWSFDSGLRQALVDRTVQEIRTGPIENYGFERLIANVLEALGATARITHRATEDKGQDIVATFNLAGALDVIVAVQAKHYYRLDTLTDATPVREVAAGMDAAGASLGLVITAGEFADEAATVADEYYESEGKQIRLLDGKELAALIIDAGLAGKPLLGK